MAVISPLKSEHPERAESVMRSTGRCGWEWNNYYARSPVVRTQHLRQRCITVRLEPGGDVHRNDVVAYRYYRSPLVAPVAVVALRTRQPCTPGRTSGPDRQR